MDVTVTKTPGVCVTLDELLALKPCRFNRSHQKKMTHQQGVYASKVKGRGMEFQEVRHYQEGDDIRHMDWRVTARTGKPHIKLYHQERERPVFIVCDFNQSMFFGTKVALKSVIAAQFAAILAKSFTLLGDKVGGLLYDATHTKLFKPKAKGLLPFLHHLSEFSQPREQHDSASLIDTITELTRIIPRNSTVFFISDFYSLNDKSLQALQYLEKKTQLFPCLVADCIEKLAPKPNVYAITDGEKEQLLNFNDKAIRQRHLSIYSNKRDALKKAVTAANLFEVSSTDNLNEIATNIGLRLSLGQY